MPAGPTSAGPPTVPISVRGCVGYDLGYGAPTPVILLGNNWSGNPHPTSPPVSNIRFEGNMWTRVGQVNIQ